MHGRPTTQSARRHPRQPPQPVAHPRRARPRPARHLHRPHHHQRRHAPARRRPRRQLGPAAMDRRLATPSCSPGCCSPQEASATGSAAATHSLAGLATFLAGSVVAATAGSTTALIVGRCVMGVGGALIMPTTLSILVNVFGDPRERAKAIAAWTAASGAGIALGPIVGGALMRSFSWSSVFWINVPLLVAALRRSAAPGPRLPRPARHPARPGRRRPVHRRDQHARLRHHPGTRARLDLDRVARQLRRRDRDRGRCSSAGRCAATSRCSTCRCSATAASPPAASPSPCCSSPWPAPCSCRPSTCSSSSTTPRWPPASPSFLPRSGCCSAPAPAPTSPQMHGGRIAVTAGTLIAAAGVAVQAAFVDGGSYLPTGVGLLLFGLGAGIAMPAATEMIMATLPPARAGVGSAVNDTVREFGGALGVAVIGSVAATSYATSMHSELDQLPEPDRHRSQHAGQQRRRRHPHQPAARRPGRPDRRRRPDRVRRLDAQLAVDRRRPRVLRRSRHLHAAAPPGSPQRTPPTVQRSPTAVTHAVANAGHHPHVAAVEGTVTGRGVGVMNGTPGDVAGDVLVVGGGAAGLTAALVLARARHRVTVDRRPDASQRDRRRVPRLPHTRCDLSRSLPHRCPRRAALVRRGDRPLRSDQCAEHRPERVDDAC